MTRTIKQNAKRKKKNPKGIFFLFFKITQTHRIVKAKSFKSFL